MPRILVSDPLSAVGLDVLGRETDLEVVVQTGLEADALRTALESVDGVIIRSSTQLTAEVLDGQPRLKGIVRAGVGIDNIDLAAATRCGIVVMNTPAGNTTSTAEHSIAMLMALSRNISPAAASLKSGAWERKKFVGTQLAGKTLAILGLGRVGLAVCERAQGLQMRVIGFDPFLSAERAVEHGIDLFDDLDRLLAEADFLTVHTPLTDQTRNLINAERIGKMKPGVRIVNCARGGIVDEEALAAALEADHVGGAAIDVFETEPPGDHPLLADPRVLATPHLGASTEEAQESVAHEAAEILSRFLLRGEVRHAVNMVPISATELEAARLYLDLGFRLGLLLAQQNQAQRLEGIRIDYRGEVVTRSTRLITASLTSGLLGCAFDADVNLVNAELVARERGIEITESSSPESGDFSTLVRGTLITDTDTDDVTASATIFGNQFLRLVRLGPYQLDAYLDGALLIFRHLDVPGLIGFIGTILGRHRVNIAHMSLGRQQDKPGGEAVAVLNLDNLPSYEAIEEIVEHPEVVGVDMVLLPPAQSPLPWLGNC